MKPLHVLILSAVLAAAMQCLRAAIPDAVPYQGRVSVGGINFSGSGQFKFAIYEQVPGDTSSATLLWTNAIGAAAGTVAEPATAVSMPVTNGLYVIGLGDTLAANMAALPASLAPVVGKRVFMRVWFNDGAHGFQRLVPDAELRSVPFAREAGSVGGVGASNLARLNAANVFTNVGGAVVQGPGPFGSSPAPNAIVPVSGGGTRMQFLPGYGAFRAGAASGTEWDAQNIGLFSSAMGYGTTASGYAAAAVGYEATASGGYSFAAGSNSLASGSTSVAMGYSNHASGNYSTALGYGAVASGFGATAIGYEVEASADSVSTAFGSYTTASGNCSTAMGSGTRALGNTATAMGLYSTASGSIATAIGSGATASGEYSVAMGSDTIASEHAATAMGSSTRASNSMATAFGWATTASGLASTSMGVQTEASGAMSMVCGNGTSAKSYAEVAIGCYNTDYTSTAIGFWSPTDRLFVIGNGAFDARSDALIVYKNGNATLQGDLSAKSFITTSDHALKTDIVPADTAAVLAKVVALPVATWKFKDETVTHLGPMAQDFFAAFQLGGTDTGIASVDADGVALAAIQELNKRVEVLAAANTVKDARIAELERAQTSTNARLAAIEAKLK